MPVLAGNSTVTGNFTFQAKHWIDLGWLELVPTDDVSFKCRPSAPRRAGLEGRDKAKRSHEDPQWEAGLCPCCWANQPAAQGANTTITGTVTHIQRYLFNN